MLAAMLVLSLLATALMAASKNWTGAGLGDLSQYYETGNSANPGRISTVLGDPGGKSYGIYMFASKAGTPLSFIKWLQEFKEGSIYRDMGDTLYNAYAYIFRHPVISTGSPPIQIICKCCKVLVFKLCRIFRR